MRTIMGIQVGDREHEAISLQELLTEHGCAIKTRLGLHENAGEGQCSSKGLILIEFYNGQDQQAQALEAALEKLTSIKVRKMVFD